MAIKTNTSIHNNYCAFLRGVNVGGINMKMIDVCAIFKKEGLHNVSSVLASGNILFSSDKEPKALKQILEKAMSKHFEYQAHLFIKDKDTVQRIISKNPFKNNADFHTYSFVGIDGVATTLMEIFKNSKKFKGEEAVVVNDLFYWRVAKAQTLLSEFGKVLGNKQLKDTFTSRNINTIERILKKM